LDLAWLLERRSAVMELDEGLEAELQELVERLDRLVPRDGAHLTIPADPDGRTTVGSRLGYLRLGVEFLASALRPLPAGEGAPARVEPRLDDLLTGDSAAPFQLCEVDESIVSRPPASSPLGAFGQLGAGILVVAVLLLAFIGGAVVFRWAFG
jgi:hypothetical protein